MGKDINLNSSAWTDLVFAGKNKAYGAYFLRNTSSKRHIAALLVVLVLVIVLSLLKFVVWDKKDTQGEQLGSISTTVSLTNIEDLDVKLPEETVQDEADIPPPPKIRESMMFTPPVIEDDDKVSSDKQMKSQAEIQQSTKMVSIADIEGSKDLDAIDIADLKEVKVEIEKDKFVADNRLYDKVDEMPKFPGGQAALINFIYSNVTFPEEAARNGKEGRVQLRFVVEKDGSIGEVRVVESVDPLIDQEAIRVIRSMPKWIPGKHRGQAVRVWFTQPITFEIR